MPNRFAPDQYTYTIQWSPAIGAWIGTCEEFPELRKSGALPVRTLASIIRLVEDEIQLLTCRGTECPCPKWAR
jgi:hypothetical protein